MKQSRNKPLPFSKGKFYNTQRGEKKNHFFFFLPSIIKSPKMFLNWDIVMYSIFIGFGSRFIQFNIFENIKDTSVSLVKEDINKLLMILRSEKIDILITDKKVWEQLLHFLDKNSYIITLLKNSNENHPYIKKIIASYFRGVPFAHSK